MIKEFFSIERFRFSVSDLDALPQFALLGIAAGFITGFLILLFRQAIEIPLKLWLPDGDPENFEALSSYLHFLAPVVGSIIIGLVYVLIKSDTGKTGVGHVLERLNYHEAHLPLKNALVQFFVGAIALISGQSAGREGPAIHLGAASGSLLGQRLHLPNNSIRILVGCGTAAAISASFNTPIAGVIFAMEVVMMEYTITGFIPVMLSSISATVVLRAVYGSEYAFLVPHLDIGSLWELPIIAVMGIVVGTLAALFIKIASTFTRYQHHSFPMRAVAAGVIMGTISWAVPEIMGVSYDSVNMALLGQMGLGLLILLALAKLVATAAAVGLGMPFGLIGPTIVIGAAAGGVFGVAVSGLLSEYVSEAGLYAMLGMGAMMGAVLQAPLAALMALLELTGNSNIILPGMLIIVIASITARSAFHQRSIFSTLLAAQGISLRGSPVTQALRRIGVESFMNLRFVRAQRIVTLRQAEVILRQKPEWVIIEEDGNPPTAIVRAAELARYLEALEAEALEASQDQEDLEEMDEQEDAADSEEADELDSEEETELEADNKKKKKDKKIKRDKKKEAIHEEGAFEEKTVDLLEFPAHRRDVCSVQRQATLQHALEHLNKTGVEAIYVQRTKTQRPISIMGVITKEDIENYYLQR